MRAKGFSSVALLAISLLLPCGLRAEVEEARSFALEAAEPHLRQGFNIRSETWSGQLKPGRRKIVRHQLFRGNEYWFWLGTPVADSGLTLKIYDRKGRPVHVESVAGKYWVASRVLAPRTGTYMLVVTAPAGAKEAEWALAYGYR